MRKEPAPRIGITNEVESEWNRWYRPYAAAVEAWGAEAVAITHENAGVRDPDVLLSELDGLLATGGPDISLACYPKRPDTGGKSFEEFEKAHCMSTAPKRDEYEVPLVKRALEIGLPILGICHGVQLVNVLLGGGLVLDIPSDPRLGGRIEHRAMPVGGTDLPRASSCHSIIVSPTSRLANAIGPAQLTAVNSRHHQGILREMLAPGLEAVAFSPGDGLIEAVESPKHRWLVAVQWHPERPEDPCVYEPCRPLFRSFVDACRVTRIFR